MFLSDVAIVEAIVKWSIWTRTWKCSSSNPSQQSSVPLYLARYMPISYLLFSP